MNINNDETSLSSCLNLRKFFNKNIGIKIKKKDRNEKYSKDSRKIEIKQSKISLKLLKSPLNVEVKVANEDKTNKLRVNLDPKRQRLKAYDTNFIEEIRIIPIKPIL